MREIKFRVWDKIDKEIYYPSTILNNWTNGEKQNHTLEQFTGLHDKNGVEIYEGDIIKGKEWEHGKSHRHIGIVTYISNSFRSVGINQYLGYHGSVDGSYE